VGVRSDVFSHRLGPELTLHRTIVATVMRSNHPIIQQCLRLFQIERVEAFGEPAVDRSEKIAGVIRSSRRPQRKP
jgi:hypothetical protein